MTSQVSMNGFSDASKPHFVLVPFFAQGHTIPMTDMACLLAEAGAVVTFVTTHVNASRMQSTIDETKASGLPIHFAILRFPCIEAGLPEGCENVDMLPSREMRKNFLNACIMLTQPLITHLHAQNQLPSCIISDAVHIWTRDVAMEFGIPKLSFNGYSGFATLARYIINEQKIFDNVLDDHEPVTVPGFPGHLQITKAKATEESEPEYRKELRKMFHEEERRVDGVVVNSVYELEALYIDAYKKITGKKVWTIGPMCLSNRGTSAIAARGNKSSVDENFCLQWLHSMMPGSVLYVSFGSLAPTAPAQLIEIGLGLEASNRPFIWVIKTGNKSSEVLEWLAEGFEKRVKDRGLIIKGWAPQMMILSHPATGGFMTHCGWNSTSEGICAGVPMITWPHFADQFLNETLVLEELKTGVAIGVSDVVNWGMEHTEVSVMRDDVERAVSRLMDEGKDGEERRLRAKDLAAKAKKAMEEAGSSYNDLRCLIRQMGTGSIAN